MQAQSGGDAAVGGDVAVASAARVLGIADCEIDFEDAVLAAQVGRFRYRAAFRGARAHIRRRLLRAEARVKWSAAEIRERDENKLFQCGDSHVPLASLPAP